jgi:predicted Zn-dependent protease
MKTKTIKKILLFGLILGLVILGGGYAGYRAYKSARQARLIAQARNHLAKPNERKALLCLQRALRYNPKDVEACRLMAELTERVRSPGALIWRSRVVELNPRSLDDRLALAQTAMTFRDYASATNALGGVDAAGKKTAAYHNIAGAVAAAANQPAEAETHFVEAVRLEPQNLAPQLNLAVVRLHRTNAPALADARAALQCISSNPTNSALRCQAVRELAVDALRHKQTDVALALSKKLLLETNSVFTDRLLRLAVLRATQNAEFKPALAAFQREAGTNMASIYELSLWRMANTGPAETLAWLRTLPRDTQTNQPVALLVAQCQTALRDWKGLQASIEKQYWAYDEFIRYAFMTRALRGQDLTGAAKGQWELGLKTANAIAVGSKPQTPQPFFTLLQLATQWKWESEAEDLLWTIVNNFPNERRAGEALTQALFDGGRTRPLMMFYSQELKRSPASLAIKNNLAMTALLLDALELKPHDLAREVYQKAPTNSAYASTYAFSLHLQKKDAEALKVMQQLSPRQLEEPSIAGYYGLVLQATGNREKAKVYFEWASKANILPEEKKLFDRAKAGA